MNDSLHRIINAHIEGETIEDYMCGLLADIDKKEVDVAKLQTKVAILKQINNRHNQLNISYKYELLEKSQSQ